MRSKVLYVTALVSLIIVMSSCRDENPPPINLSIVGKWSGKTVDIKANPDGIIPAFTIPDKELPITIEFHDNGSVTLIDKNNKSYNGSYVQTNEKLTLTIDYKFEFLDLTGEYKIEELTRENMKVSTSRTGTFDVPSYGQFNGSIKATFHFVKASN